jgi:hypothetical protein
MTSPHTSHICVGHKYVRPNEHLSLWLIKWLLYLAVRFSEYAQTGLLGWRRLSILTRLLRAVQLCSSFSVPELYFSHCDTVTQRGNELLFFWWARYHADHCMIPVLNWTKLHETVTFYLLVSNQHGIKRKEVKIFEFPQKGMAVYALEWCFQKLCESVRWKYKLIFQRGGCS